MKLTYLLAIMAAVHVVLSIVELRRERVQGFVRSKELRITIRRGIIWINVPVLLILLAPAFVRQHFAPDSGLATSAFALLMVFLAAWAWWSVNVSLWRRWAKRSGVDSEELQILGQSSRLLWPKGHFFERTEFDRLRGS